MTSSQNDSIALITLVLIVVAATAILYSVFRQPADVRERTTVVPSRQQAPEIQPLPWPNLR